MQWATKVCLDSFSLSRNSQYLSALTKRNYCSDIRVDFLKRPVFDFTIGSPSDYHHHEMVRDKGHHEVYKATCIASGEDWFIKHINEGAYSKYYVEKEALASRLCMYLLGPKHTPKVKILNDKDKYYIASRAMPNYFDLSSFYENPFFIGKNGETRIRMLNNNSVAVYGRIRTKYVLFFLNEQDQQKEFKVENVGISLIAERSPFVTIDHEDCLSKAKSPISSLPITEAAKSILEQGVNSVFDCLNFSDQERKGREETQHGIIKDIANIPLIHLESHFNHSFSEESKSKYSSLIWDGMYADLIERKGIFAKAAELIDGKKAALCR